MTSYESICTAFLTQLMMVMKNRKMAVMEAKNEKSRRRRKFQIQKEEENWRTEVVRINEAFQHLTRKKDRSDTAVKSWKVQSHHNVLVTKTLDILALDPEKGCTSNEEKKKYHAKKKAESERAQQLALQIASHIDSMGSEKDYREKPKTQNGYGFLKFLKKWCFLAIAKMPKY